MFLVNEYLRLKHTEPVNDFDAIGEPRASPVLHPSATGILRPTGLAEGEAGEDYLLNKSGIVAGLVMHRTWFSRVR